MNFSSDLWKSCQNKTLMNPLCASKNNIFFCKNNINPETETYKFMYIFNQIRTFYFDEFVISCIFCCARRILKTLEHSALLNVYHWQKEPFFILSFYFASLDFTQFRFIQRNSSHFEVSHFAFFPLMLSTQKINNDLNVREILRTTK